MRSASQSGNETYQDTVFAVARDDDGSMFTAFDDAGFDSQIKSAFFVASGVAFETVLAQDRPDVTKKVDACVIGRLSRGRDTAKSQRTAERHNFAFDFSANTLH